MNKNIVTLHHRSDWTIEKDAEIREYRFYYVKTGLDWVYEIKNEYNPNYRGTNAITLSQSLGYANRYAESNYVYNCLYYYNQLRYAHFFISLNEEKLIKFTIADKQIETIGKKFTSDIGSGAVIGGICAAQILRDKKALAFYADIPVTFTEQQNQEDIIGETMMYFYQTLIKGEADKDTAAVTHHHINSFLDWEEYKKYIKVEGYNSLPIWKTVFDMRKPTTASCLLPVLEIYNYILHQDQGGYEKAVYEALVKWKEYFTKPVYTYPDEPGREFDHSTYPQGYLALEIAAACAYAYDRGMKLETVESDYIPRWMIEGRFEGFELLVKGDSPAS